MRVVSTYEYRTIRLERGTWPAFSGSVFAACSDLTEAADGSVSALFAGMIGFAADEGVLMRAWPNPEALANNAARTLTVEGLVESCVQALQPTVRPVGTVTPTEQGVYAHRWFWLRPEAEDEFVRLSEEGVWPFFESDGCEIIGLWRPGAGPSDRTAADHPLREHRALGAHANTGAPAAA